jgi:hypothetical protein
VIAMRAAVLASVLVACGPGGGDPVARSALDAIVLDEDTILLVPADITIVGPAGTPATATATVTGGGAVVELVGVETSDPGIPPAIAFVDPPCALQGCSFAPGLALPRQVTLGCTPQATPRTAIVKVIGNGGVQDTSTVTCVAQASNPQLAVPGSVGPIAAQVGATAPAPLVVTNAGDVALNVSVMFQPGADWGSAMCVAPAACPVAPGQMLQIPVTFSPAAHGPRNSTLRVDTSPSTGTKFVMLDGTGFGGVLRVDEPAGFALAFGTIARDQVVTTRVALTNTGNQAITITPSALPAPFAVVTDPVTLAANGGTGTFDVTCTSPTAGGPFTGVIELVQSANTYARNTDSVSVSCTIANTTAQVTPSPLDFGQLRVGAPAGELVVTVANPPGGGAIMVQRIALAGAPDALALGPSSLPLPAMLADGAELTATLELDTAADLVLDGVVLEVELVERDPVVLQVPVVGKVGTPRAVVLPPKLALGTVCVGTPITSEVALTNTGTVTLALRRPTMTGDSFAPTFTSPTSYPDPPDGVPLLEGDSAIVRVTPANPDVPGPIATTLEWDVDVPLAPFVVPITVEYLESGTALSPASMSFGGRELASRSPPQIVTLENCGTEPVVISYRGVRGLERDGRAWILEPPGDERTLPPDGTMRITVAFQPREPGLHRAELPIDIDGVRQIVELDGTGLGDPIDETSFYACSCSGGGTPAHGWPIALVIMVVAWPRRAAG